MVDISKGGTSVDAGVTIDREDFLQSGITLALAQWIGKLHRPLKTVSYWRMRD